MITIEKVKIDGFKTAIRGMRNSFNSWDKMDSVYVDGDGVGLEDAKLMIKLSASGSSHAKFRRFIVVTMDITAPLYWWKEFDTYKVGTVANSCSTMHTIAEKPFELDDFSHEHLMVSDDNENYMIRAQIEDHFYEDKICFPFDLLSVNIDMLNQCRTAYLSTKDKKYWWQMIQLLPSSYNQKRTVLLNYEVLHAIYGDRRYHKLDEWRSFCSWIETLPYAEGIIFEEGE